MGRDTRFIVTNLMGPRGKHLYEKIYSARGQAENHIKGWKSHLASDRTSCTKASANQMRLMLHGCAYWLWWTLRAACPKRSPWRRAQFDTLRLHLSQTGRDHRREENKDRHDAASLVPTSEPHQGSCSTRWPRRAPHDADIAPPQILKHHQPEKLPKTHPVRRENPDGRSPARLQRYLRVK